MSANCPFEIGDAVFVQGICGKVVDRQPLGGGYVLHVLLGGGGVAVVSCAGVQACPDETYSAPCGAPTRRGTPCLRPVSGGGRCYQHGG